MYMGVGDIKGILNRINPVFFSKNGTVDYMGKCVRKGNQLRAVCPQKRQHRKGWKSSAARKISFQRQALGNVMVRLFGHGLGASNMLEELPPDYGLREHLSSYNRSVTLEEVN